MSSHVTYVIGEAGACGDADLTKMLAQIDACAKAGVNAVKFQWTSDATAMGNRRGRATADGYDLIYRRYLMWDDDWHQHLYDRCVDVGVDYLCTVYLPKDVRVVSSYVAHFKVSSFEAKDTDLHHAVLDQCRDGKRMMLSLGMCSDLEIDMLRFSLADVQCIDYLHCISAYPTPFPSMNLSRIHRNRLDGYSDHTSPQLTMTGALAVAAGARIIEAHMKLDTTDDWNPDAPHAMTPLQLTDYVSQIRMTEDAMSSDDDSAEELMRPYRVEG
jgi:N,N'-diacetyllegionaminate synthase